MKLLYIANARIPTEKAHGIQIMKMCEAFAENGADITLVVPKRINKIKRNAFDYYGIEKKFKIKELPVIDFLPINIFKINSVFLLATVTFAISLFFYLLFKRDDYIIYTRGEMVLFLAKLARVPFFWETHIEPKNLKRYGKAIAKSVGLVVATRYYKESLLQKLKLNNDKILYASDGVDLDKFDIKISKEDARKKLNLPLYKKIILYTGSDVEWKGLNILKDASDYLKDSCSVILAGNIKNESLKYKNIVFAGHKSHSEIPVWLKAADVLVLSGTAKSEISKYYTSPLKLFEYMASERSIIAPRLPSFLDILNDSNAFLTEPDNAEDLADKINFALENKEQSDKIALRAFSDVKNYTWKKRGKRIMSFINK